MFFSHSGKICPNCVSKDSMEIQKLENYIDEYAIPNNIEQLSYNTGISTKNLQRFITENKKFSSLSNL